MSDPRDLVRLNLKGGQVLLLQATNQGASVLVQILNGFGASKFHRCTTAAQAREVVQQETIDLMLVEGQLDEGGEDGYAFVKWLRNSNLVPNAFMPILMTVAHTSAANIARARDCGAHFVIGKPVVPAVLWDRVLWISQSNRAFVKAGTNYSGPDRRFRNDGPPAGMAGRRSTDVAESVSDPKAEDAPASTSPGAQDAGDAAPAQQKVSL